MPSASWVSHARSASVPLRRFSARVGLVLVAVLVALGIAVEPAPAAAQQSGTGVITLTSQDPWVESSSTPVRLGLKVHSSVPASDLSVNIGLYAEPPDGSGLTSRDEFDATLSGQTSGLLQISLLQFSIGELAAGNGSLELYAGGAGLPGTIPAKTPAGRVFQLPCPQDYGGCDGVYPLQVSLEDTLSFQTLDIFTTYLIVAPPQVASQRRLRFSFIVPVGAPLALTPAGTAAVPAQTLGRITTLAGEASNWPGAPLTLDLYGQTLLALSRSPHAGLVASVASGGAANLVAGPFSAVDPTDLVEAGLGDEVVTQFARSRAVFAKDGGDADPSPVYVATSSVGTDGLSALAAAGLKQVVVPEANLQSGGHSGATATWPSTLTAPFRIAGSSFEGLQADSGLAAHLNGPGSSALRAQQLLADLAEIYFDSPNYPQTRGVALTAPLSWTPQPGFLNATLRGLQSSPIVTAVPVSELFQTVPTGTCGQPPIGVTGCSAAVRTIAEPTGQDGGGITFGDVSTARAEISELSSVEPTAAATIQNYNDAVLLAQTAGLDSVVRQEFLSASLATMRSLGSMLSLPAARTFTVTSSSARFPITVTSKSPATLHVVLSISGPKLSSPTTTRLVLHRGTTGFIVRVTTRTSGDSNVQLELLSPTGGVVLAHQQSTIRSTAISGVAIGLTVGAGAFLLAWWLRSALRRGRRRAGKHVRVRTHEPGTGSVPEPAS